MADFVAVIRRAVDGLANNTPEMRAKVYDKARSAVQRQLENMKPRPPEDMLARQMEKLEAAIVSVEEEHSEALPPVEEAAPVPEAAVDHVPVEPAPAEPVEQAPVWQEDAETPPPAQYQAPEAEATPVQHAPEHDEVPPQEYQPVEEDRPVEAAPVFREEDHEQPVSATQPVYREDDYQAPAVQPAVVDEPVEPVSETLEEQSVPVSAEEPVHAQPSAPHYGDWRDDVPPEESLPPSSSFEQSAPEPTRAPAFDIAVKDHIPAVPAAAAAANWAEPASGGGQVEDDFPYPTRGDEPAPQPAAAEAALAWGGNLEPEAPAAPLIEEPKPVESWAWEASAPVAAEPSVPAAPPSYDAAAAWNDIPELVPAGPVEPINRGASLEHAEAHFDAENHVAADTVRMPSVAELPDLGQQPVATAASAAAFVDPLADFLDTHSAPAAKAQEANAVDTGAPPVAKAAEPGASAGKTAESDPWNDLEELIGFNKDGTLPGSTPARGSGMHTEADADDLMSAPARPYRVKPARKRNYAGILLGIVGLALVGGGGYAVWLNRNSLNDMVDGLIQSSLPGSSQTAQQAPASSTPAPTRPSTPANPTPTNPGPNANSSPAPAAPARTNTAANNAAAPPRSADGAVAGSKFTQRLMPDGSESDQGPGTAGTLAQNAEGQSVAQLNAPPRNQPAGAAANANPPAGSPNTASPANPAPSAGPADVPAAAGEKMFLYEERIGQAAPTAIDGTVSWSLQREAQANGRQEPVIQGRLTVPGRGLSALVTIKRNNDSSLPASHLIEIVFAIPPDFEGGAIDSVQRIAMKASEQDRGNALIAVPAKITDDFHMIALNDFPDARATNLELLRSRAWMDIPMAYRNGRRALLTLQKGAQGDRVFNDAIREWSTLGPTTSGQ